MIGKTIVPNWNCGVKNNNNKLVTQREKPKSSTSKRPQIMSSEATNGQINDWNDQIQSENGLQRKNSLERYRPGAYFNEEREKLRRRAHFGERRLDIDKANGHRGRGGRGGQRGRGRGSNNFNSYRNGTKSREYEEDDADNESEFNHQEDDLQASPPPLGNWADQLSDQSPETVRIKDEILSFSYVKIFGHFIT